MQSNTTTLKPQDSKLELSPRLEPILKLLNDEKYNEAAKKLGYEATKPQSGRSTMAWITQSLSLFKDTPATTNSSTFTSAEIGQVVNWLCDKKANFPSLFLNTALGHALVKGTFSDHKSPILASLESHDKLFEIIKYTDFRPEHIGNLLYQLISTNKKNSFKLLSTLPNYCERPRDYLLHDDITTFNDNYDNNPARFCDPATGNRPLHIACSEEKPDEKLINEIIERGAFLTDRNNKHETPLSLLISKNINLIHFFENGFGSYSKEHLCKIILDLSLKGEYSIARFLIEKADKLHYKLDLYYYDEASGNTILHLAVQQKVDPEFTRLALLHSDKNSIEKENKSKLTPLLSAIELDNDETVKLFFETCIQKKSSRRLGLSYKDGAADLFSPQQEWIASNTPSTLVIEPSYDFSSEQLGNAFIALIKKNKLDLAITLLEKRPDTRVNTIESSTQNNVLHHIATSDHTKKESLFLLLCKKNLSLEKPNKQQETPLSLLAQRAEFTILSKIFTELKGTFTIETLTSTAKDIILGQKKLDYLREYLLQVQSLNSIDTQERQKHTKSLLIQLVDHAKSSEEVTAIGKSLRDIETQTRYFYTSPTPTSITPSIEVMVYSYKKIVSFYETKPHLVFPTSLAFDIHDSKSTEAETRPTEALTATGLKLS